MQIHKYIKFPKNYRTIDSKVSGGANVLSPFKMYKLQKNGITDIIDLRNESTIPKFIEKYLCKLFNINYTNIKISFKNKSIPSMDTYHKINNLLVENQKTYVHCRLGKHRTGIFLAAYEKMSTSHNDNEIIKKLNKFWQARETLKLFYDDFISKFNIKN